MLKEMLKEILLDAVLISLMLGTRVISNENF